MVHSEEELKMLVTASQEAGVLEEGEEQMLHRVFGFADLTAGQVMVPRTELIAVSAAMSRQSLIDEIVARRVHAACRSIATSLDDVVGILHVVDLLKPIAAGGNVDAAALAREALTVPADAGRRRRAGRDAAARRPRGPGDRRIRRHGGHGHVRIAHGAHRRRAGDRGDRRASTCCRMDRPTSTAWCSSTEVNLQFGLQIDQDTFTTVGGFVLGQLGRRPRIGDMVAIDGRTMRVDALDGIRVARVRLSAPKTGSPKRQRILKRRPERGLRALSALSPLLLCSRPYVQRSERVEYLLVVGLVPGVVEDFAMAHVPSLSITNMERLAMPLRPIMSSLNAP